MKTPTSMTPTCVCVKPTLKPPKPTNFKYTFLIIGMIIGVFITLYFIMALFCINSGEEERYVKVEDKRKVDGQRLERLIQTIAKEEFLKVLGNQLGENIKREKEKN